MLTLDTAQQAIAQHANNTFITADSVAQLLQDVQGTTFAQITYVTKVATAARYKDINIVKVTAANVQLFNNVASDVYKQQVQRSAAKIDSNNKDNVANFKTQDNYFAHTACYSVVQHKQNNKQYLYCIYNNAQSLYFIDNVLATKQQVAEYLTASAAQQLLNTTATTYNVANSVEHTVVVRTIQLNNIVSIAAQQQKLAVA